MEVGKRWTDEETGALLKIWSDHRIQRRLKNLLRNAPVFAHIALLFRKVGYTRSVKQLQEKVKKLRSEYMAERRRKAENMASTVQFKHFDIMHSVLGDHPVSNLEDSTTESEPADPSYDINEKSMHGEVVPILISTDQSYAAELSSTEMSPTTLMDENASPDGKKQSHAVILLDRVNSRVEVDNKSSVILEVNDKYWGQVTETDILKSNEGTRRNLFEDNNHDRTCDGRRWGDAETKTLLKLWSDPKKQRKLRSLHRNSVVYAEIAQEMRVKGFSRTVKQLQDKVKKLKVEYMKARQKPADGEKVVPFKYFALMDAVLGDHSFSNMEDSVLSSDEINHTFYTRSSPLSEVALSEEENAAVEITADHSYSVEQSPVQAFMSDSAPDKSSFAQKKNSTTACQEIIEKMEESDKLFGQLFMEIYDQHWEREMEADREFTTRMLKYMDHDHTMLKEMYQQNCEMRKKMWMDEQKDRNRRQREQEEREDRIRTEERLLEDKRREEDHIHEMNLFKMICETIKKDNGKTDIP